MGCTRLETLSTSWPSMVGMSAASHSQAYCLLTPSCCRPTMAAYQCQADAQKKSEEFRSFCLAHVGAPYCCLCWRSLSQALVRGTQACPGTTEWASECCTTKSAAAGAAWSSRAAPGSGGSCLVLMRPPAVLRWRLLVAPMQATGSAVGWC